MRSFRFLLSRRWILFALAIVATGAATWWLGQWQFDRLEERRADNAAVRQNEDLAPAPVADVLAPGGDVSRDEEWRVVSATGTYAVEDTVVIRYSTSPKGEGTGVDVVVPLVTDAGAALLVNRGWMPVVNQGGDIGEVPAPPSGEVTVTGYVRQDGTGDSTRVADLSARAVDSSAIGEAVGREVYGGWVELRSEDPPPAEGEATLEPVELPELDDGPHFFYGLQWWFFGVLAVVGFVWFAYDEWSGGPARRRRDKQERLARRARRDERAQSARSIPPSTGSIAPDTNDAAGDSRNAAARPNSSGSP